MSTLAMDMTPMSAEQKQRIDDAWRAFRGTDARSPDELRELRAQFRTQGLYAAASAPSSTPARRAVTLDAARASLAAVAASTDPHAAARARRGLEALDRALPVPQPEVARPKLSSVVAALRAAARGKGADARAARRALISLSPADMTERELRNEIVRIGRGIAALEADMPTSRAPSAPAPSAQAHDLDVRMGLAPPRDRVERRGNVMRFGVAKHEQAAIAGDDDAVLRARALERARALTAQTDERTDQQRELAKRMGVGFKMGVERRGNVMRFGVLLEADR